MPSVRLRAADWGNPVYLEEILSEGTLADWRLLYQHLAEYPFGSTAAALEWVLAARDIYGATPLWKGILCHARGTSA